MDKLIRSERRLSNNVAAEKEARGREEVIAKDVKITLEKRKTALSVANMKIEAFNIVSEDAREMIDALKIELSKARLNTSSGPGYEKMENNLRDLKNMKTDHEGS